MVPPVARRRRRRSGFSLVETMVAVAMFAVMLCVATQGLASYNQRTMAKTCAANLSDIEAAKREWALAARKGDGATCDIAADLVGVDKYLPAAPVCPLGGRYTANGQGTVPTCSIGDNGSPADPRDDHAWQQ